MGYGTPSFVFMDFFKQRRGNSFETSEEITAKAEKAVVMSKGARCEIKQRMVTPFSSLARSTPRGRYEFAFGDKNRERAERGSTKTEQNVRLTIHEQEKIERV